MNLLRWFAEPLTHEFMQRGLVVAVLVGTVCALLSCYLVLKGWSLMGDAISHAVLPGIVLAYLWSIPLVIGAFVAGLVCTTGSAYLREHCRVKEDSVMAIVFSGMFALGLVLFVKVDSDQHLNHILFGNMLGVRWSDVIDTALIAVPVSAIVIAKRRDLLLFCFDAAHARAMGLSVGMLHYGLLALVALAIVASLKAVGVILVIAMLITPGAIGFLLAKQFGRLSMIAVAAAVSSCVIGTIASFHLDAATGPTIVMVQTVGFILALAASQVKAHYRRRSGGATGTVAVTKS
ncbi:MAG: iron ABC transporter permease [Burkholderiales bacterium PBB1]|nr:MAG: iron ABC transporter permease [Burkholderiales bacterium PBB1]